MRNDFWELSSSYARIGPNEKSEFNHRPHSKRNRIQSVLVEENFVQKKNRLIFHGQTFQFECWRNWHMTKRIVFNKTVLELNLISFDFSLWIEVGQNAIELHSLCGLWHSVVALSITIYPSNDRGKKNAKQKSFKLILIELHLSHFQSTLTALGKILDY